MPQISRRDFVKLGAVSAGALGTTPLGFDLAEAVQVQQNLRIDEAKEVHSLCPYCAVGCSLIAYTKEVNGKTQLLQIEGDPDSPVNEGRPAQRARPPCSSQRVRGASPRRCTARRARRRGKRRAGTSCSTSSPRT